MSVGYSSIMVKTAAFILSLNAGLFAQLTPQQSPADKVVARIDGKDWTVKALGTWLDSVPAQVRNAYAQNPAETLSKTLLLQHLAALAELDHLDQEPNVQQSLAWVRGNLLSEWELNRVRLGYEPSSEEVRSDYEENPQRWEQAIVRAIYVSLVPDERLAKAKIADLRKRLEAGADFAQLARENSDDKTSAEKGGVWNRLSRSSAYPEAVKRVIFALRPGEISQPVRQPDGFYLFKLESIEKQPLQEAESGIARELAQVHFNQWLDKLKARFAGEMEDPSFFPPVTEKIDVDGDGDDDDDVGTTLASVTEAGTETPPDRVVVKIDGKSWNASEVRNYVATLPPEIQEGYRRNALKTLSDGLMLRYLAEQAELHRMEEDRQLTQNVQWARMNLLAEAALKNSRLSYRPPLEQEKQFYSQNIERWEQAKARAILISFSTAAPDGTLVAWPPGVTVRSEEQAEAKVEELRQKLAAGADFAELARLNSDDTLTASKGGQLDPMNRNSPYPKALKDAIFELKPGAVSQSVRQPNGFYLLRLESLQRQSFAEVEPTIFSEIQQTHFNQWLNKLRARFAVQVEDAEFLAVHPQRLP